MNKLSTISNLLNSKIELKNSSPDHIVIFESKKKHKNYSLDQHLSNIRSSASTIAKSSNFYQQKAIIFIHDNYIWDIIHNACLGLGITVVGIDVKTTCDDIKQIIKTLKPQILFFDQSIPTDGLNLFLNFNSNIKTIFKCGTLDNTNEDDYHSIFINIGRTNDTFKFPQTNEADIATIIFSSGTTGQPKVIPFTQRQIVLAIELIISHYNLQNNYHKTICWMPLSNIFQRIINLVALSTNAKTCYVNNHKNLFNSINFFQPDFLVGVPILFEQVYKTFEKYEQFIKKIPFLHFLIYFLKQSIKHKFTKTGNILLLSGSAACSIKTLSFFKDIDIPIYEAYGTSENIIPISANTQHKFKIGSVGMVLKVNTVKIINNQIHIRGPGVITNYYNSSSGTLDINDFYNTQDTGYFDKEGFLFITGRSSNVFKTQNGKKIIPETIEKYFMTLPDINHAVIIGENQPFPIAILNIKNTTNIRKLHKEIVTNGHFKFIHSYLFIKKRFTINEELTSNFKIKRLYIIKRYEKEIQQIYNNNLTTYLVKSSNI